MAGGLASPPESHYNSPHIPVASSSLSMMPLEQLTPPEFVNPRDLQDPTDSDGESVEQIRLTEKQIDGEDDPMVGFDARAQLDSQENGDDDPMVDFELKVVSSDPQKGGEDDPMHGRDLEVQISKDRPSKHVTKEFSQMHSVELVEPSSKEPPLTMQNATTKESTQMSVDSEIANKLDAFDLRRSSRNSAKEKPSQKVTNPPKLSNVKRKSVVKKDGILSLVSVE
jgi:hypothetical protein